MFPLTSPQPTNICGPAEAHSSRLCVCERERPRMGNSQEHVAGAGTRRLVLTWSPSRHESRMCARFAEWRRRPETRDRWPPVRLICELQAGGLLFRTHRLWQLQSLPSRRKGRSATGAREAPRLIHHVAPSPDAGYLRSPLLRARSHKHLCSHVHVLSISPSRVAVRGGGWGRSKGHRASS
ncbi:hypothetical protein SKAU_G00106740 [Synaphobranchus kaupii]|uniref:Uncharacterized protein n=1 Tax=Synaphobranchus kaupii TaxID=118154 RepID=A0A9Q1FZN2_SYNKA|nr:hypothetical protein SKAU_G00106740 [Synaphobranchus kaupii]